MSRPLALLRPEPSWSASASVARGMGLEVVGHPMFDEEPIAWELPEGEFDVLLAGSVRVFRHGGSKLAGLRGLPVHAVGENTAHAARAAGFAVAETGADGLQALLDAATGQGIRFLRLTGEERVALRPHPGQHIAERAVYRMLPRSIQTQFAADLVTRRPLVALHSAAAARQFATEIDRLEIARGTQFLLALGPRIAKEAGLGWAALHIVDSPSEAALLAKAAALCK